MTLVGTSPVEATEDDAVDWSLSAVTCSVDAVEDEETVGWTTSEGTSPVDATDRVELLDAASDEVALEVATVGVTDSLVTLPVDATYTTSSLVLAVEEGVVGDTACVSDELVGITTTLEVVSMDNVEDVVELESEAAVGERVVEGEEPVDATKASVAPDAVVKSSDEVESLDATFAASSADEEADEVDQGSREWEKRLPMSSAIQEFDVVV